MGRLSGVSYRTLAQGSRAQALVEVKRSRFLGVVQRAGDEATAREVIADMRRRHRDAGHHCTAFVIGPDRALRRSNDDGEPSGTAGAPMLEVLVGAGLSDVVAVVARWFGGTLLGAGGLARAYADTVSSALERASVVGREERVLADVDLPHARAGRVEADLRARGIEVLGTDYGERATLRLAAATYDDVETALAAATSGEAVPRRLGTAWVDV